MANIPLFTELDDKARKSPLGYGYFNALALNELALDNLHEVEHLDSGEHNAAEIARCLGRVRYNAGYTLEGFNSYASLAGGSGTYNPAVGTLILTLTTDLLTESQVVLQVCSQSETGLTKPCLVTAYPTSTTTLEFHSSYLSSALGAGNTWAAEDASFTAAIHSAPLQDTSYVGPAIPAALQRGDPLTYVAHDNQMVAAEYLRTRQLVAHAAGGTHNVREIAKAYGHVTYSGGSYTADSGAVGLGTITRTSAGVLSVALSPSLTTPVCVLVSCDYPRTAGFSSATLIPVVPCAPRSVCGGSSIGLYFYGYDDVANAWYVSDADFHIAVFGA